MVMRMTKTVATVIQAVSPLLGTKQVQQRLRRCRLGGSGAGAAGFFLVSWQAARLQRLARRVRLRPGSPPWAKTKPSPKAKVAMNFFMMVVLIRW
jgi:hypothetical protein